VAESPSGFYAGGEWISEEAQRFQRGKRYGRGDRYKRNGFVVGEVDATAFQTSVRLSGMDPLPLPVFDELSLPCIPHLGA